MTYIPNAREGENGYSDKDLKGEYKAYLEGYDAAVADITNLENNLEVYADSLTVHFLSENEKARKELFGAIKDWAEMERNETAVSLIDQQSEEEDEEV